MKRIAAIALAVALIGIPLQMRATPVTIVNGNFSNPIATQNGGIFNTYGSGTLPLVGNTTDLPGWTINGSIDQIGTYWAGPHLGDQSLDMNGFQDAGSIQQNVQLTSGSQATVNFYLAGNPDAGPEPKTLAVSLIGNLGGTQTFTFDASLATHDSMGWVYKSAVFNILTPGTYTLEFSSVGDLTGSYGPVLADVSMSTPDGGLTIALLGFALVGVEGLRRKLSA